VAWLIGDSEVLAGWSATSGRSRGSRLCLAHRMWWPELFWPRAQERELIGGEKLGLNTGRVRSSESWSSTEGQ
jgi:hypothetical protein